MRAALFLSLILVSCSIPVEPESVVSSFRFQPSAFDSFARNTQIVYTLRAPVTTSLSIVRRDSAGRNAHVKTIMSALHETRGTHAHTWLGDTEFGTFAPSGVYYGILVIGDERFESIVRIFHS